MFYVSFIEFKDEIVLEINNNQSFIYELYSVVIFIS